MASENGVPLNRRAAEFGPEITHAADVVFVSVSNKNSFDFFFILRKIGNVGYDDVDPGVSSVGNDIPISMIMMFSPYSRAVIFLPISPTPPRNTTFNDFAKRSPPKIIVDIILNF